MREKRLESFHAARLLLGAVAENRENFFGRPSAGQAVARRAIVQEFRDGSEGAEMGLKLVFRHDEEDDEFHRRIIEGVEFDSLEDRPNAATTCSIRSEEAAEWRYRSRFRCSSFLRAA